MASRKSEESSKQSTVANAGLTAHIDGQEFHLGYSRIACFDGCPKAYKYGYVDGIRTPGGIPMRRGTAYHAVLEALLQYKMANDGELMALDAADKIAVKCAKKEGLTPSEIYKVIDAARFYHSEMYAKNSPIAVEQDFTIYRGGVKLTGRIDLVETTGRVIDFKFSYDKWAEPRAKFGSQPIVYQWAGLDYLPKKFKNWHYTGFGYQIIRLWPSPLIQEIDIDMIPQWESDWYEEQIAQIAGCIKAGLFPARPSDKGCSWCGHKELCQPAIWNIRMNDTCATEAETKDSLEDFNDCD